MTVLTKNQHKTFGPVKFSEDKRNYQITADVRFDDECGNGHNSFAITSDIHLCDVKGNPVRWDSGGCQHEEVAKHFPELAPYIKWHLCSTDGPMHYIANTMYHLKEGKIDYAKSSAIYGALPEDSNIKPEDMNEQWLTTRLPALLAEFQKAVESLGFVY